MLMSPKKGDQIMSPTSEMLKKYLDGYEIVVVWGPHYQKREDGYWPVLYSPRFKTDPHPWVPVGDWDEDFPPRYSGGELAALPTAAQKAPESPQAPALDAHWHDMRTPSERAAETR